MNSAAVQGRVQIIKTGSQKGVADLTAVENERHHVIDQGVFHNDVIAVSNRQVLFCHEQAFAHQEKLLATLHGVRIFIRIQLRPACSVADNTSVSTQR